MPPPNPYLQMSVCPLERCTEGLSRDTLKTESLFSRCAWETIAQALAVLMAQDALGLFLPDGSFAPVDAALAHPC